MKKTQLLATLTASAMLAGSAQADIYVWTGAASNNLNVAGNWLVGGGVPGAAPTDASDQPRTPLISDTLLFDSLDASFSQNPRTMYINSNARPWGSMVFNNGTFNFRGDNNSYRMRTWGGTDTVVVGDGDVNAATVNLLLRELNNTAVGGSLSNTMTYTVYSDGTLVNGQGSTLKWSNSAGLDTVMRLIGGASIINGVVDEATILGDADDYVSFEDYGSTFTFDKGGAGFFDEASDITTAYGDSFRLGGGLNDGNAALQLTDNGSSWTIEAVVPEPGSLALLGLGGLCVLRRRRGV